MSWSIWVSSQAGVYSSCKWGDKLHTVRVHVRTGAQNEGLHVICIGSQRASAGMIGYMLLPGVVKQWSDKNDYTGARLLLYKDLFYIVEQANNSWLSLGDPIRDCFC